MRTTPKSGTSLLKSMSQAQASFALFLLYAYLSLLQNGYLAEGHVGRQLVFKAVDADELAVELLLVGV